MKPIRGEERSRARAGILGLLLVSLGSCASLSDVRVPAGGPREDRLASSELARPSINLDRSGGPHPHAILPAPRLEPLPATPPRSAYLSRALGEFERVSLAGGILLVLKKSPGKTTAAAVLALPGLAGLDPQGKNGLAALALSLMARGDAGSPRGSLDRNLAAAGARLSLVELEPGDLALLLEGPRKALPDLLSLLAAAAADPAFLKEDFPDTEFEASLRTLRLAERRRAQAPFREGEDGNLPSSSLGSAAGLQGLGLAEARAFWIAALPAIRPRIAVLGDFSARELATALASPLAAWAARTATGAAGPSGAVPGAPAPRTGPGFWPNAYDDRAAGILLAFSLPPGWSEESAAFLVGLQFLEDSLIREFELRGLGSQGLRIDALPGGSGLGTISIAGGEDRAKARAAFDAALALLLAGRATMPGGSTTTTLGAALDSAKARAIARAYRGMAGGDIVLAVAADIATGGDGAAFYRFEGAIENVSAESVRQALAAGLAPERLLGAGPAR